MIWWFGLVMGIALFEVGIMLMVTNDLICMAFGGFSCAFGGMWFISGFMEEKNEENKT